MSFSSVFHIGIMLYLVYNQFRQSYCICLQWLPWENSKLGLSGGFRGCENPILSHFCLFSEILCLFLQFPTLESCYIWFTISLEYPSAYVQSCCLGIVQNQGLSGGIRGCVNPILSHFCLFSVIFCIFLKCSTLESCYIWFTISSEYPSAFIYSTCSEKILKLGGSLTNFNLFSEIFIYF